MYYLYLNEIIFNRIESQNNNNNNNTFENIG